MSEAHGEGAPTCCVEGNNLAGEKSLLVAADEAASLDGAGYDAPTREPAGSQCLRVCPASRLLLQAPLPTSGILQREGKARATNGVGNGNDTLFTFSDFGQQWIWAREAACCDGCANLTWEAAKIQALQARLRQRRQTRHAPRPNAQKHAMPPSPGPDLAPAAAEEDDGDQAWASVCEEDDGDQAAQGKEEAAGESSVMLRFWEYVAQMEQWGNAAAQQLEGALLETAAAAANAERELQERPPPPELVQVEPMAPDTALAALELSLDFEDPPTAPEPEPLADALSFLAEIAAQARAEALRTLAGEPPEAGEAAGAELQGEPEEEELQQEIHGADEATSFEAIERRIEEERVACLMALEEQHQELVRQMQEEEEERREEEVRLREQVHMHSEELNAREFYANERSAERGEVLRMRNEDALSRQAREEERRLKEDAERAREASERQRLEREDQISRGVRRREHEQRERVAMGTEEHMAELWRQKLRLEMEMRGFSAADAESRCWRDVSKEVEECRRMSAEDQHSNLQRLCNARIPEISAQAVQTEEPADIEVLGKMIIPESSTASRPIQAPQAGELNPWDSAPSMPQRRSKEKQVRTCGNAVCVKLAEGALRKRGHRLSGHACRPPRSASCQAVTPAELGLELAGGLEDLLMSPAALVRLEVRMEGLESLPLLSRLSQLRTLVLSGNKIHGSLEALQHCPHLEELDLCQNSLTSLDGLRNLKYLSVLKATMNEISDAEDLAHLSMLRVLDLSKNRLSSVPLSSPVLAKLILYRNSIDSTSLLRSLGSLTQVDLGRNKLTELDDISEWTPLLQKAFLYENRLASLPELHLPLLTDLWVDNNCLEVLGPLGFLPSLERLQAKHNRIRSLAQPIAASPLLKTLELAFNQLEATEIPKAVSPLWRLTRLQLNDNPLVNELMEKYRPWILNMTPELEELDHETVSEVERRSPEPLSSLGMGRAMARCVAEDDGPQRGRQGLLGLVAPKSMQRQPWPEEPEGPECHSSTTNEALERWKAAWSTPGPAPAADESGCQMCKLACWCEALNAARSVPLVAHTREERRTAALMSTTRSQHDAHFALQRRHDFWTAFLELCWGQWESFAPHAQSSVLRNSVFELQLPGAELSTQGLLRRLQARWRGMLARRELRRRRLRRLCGALSERQRRCFVQLQAVWRGRRERQRLRQQNVVLPGDRRLAEYGRAATQLQAALRGSRLRQKLRWAKEVSKLTGDDLEECPAVDLNDFLDNARRVAEADPFSLRLPQAKRPPKPVPESQPMAAWGTPPPTAGDRQGEAVDRHEGSAPGTPLSRPDSGFVAGPRRSRSLSSTAESAVTEDGRHTGHGRNRAEQAKEEWGFKDLSTARNYLKAQRRRQPRPPTLPAASLSRSAVATRKASGARSDGGAACPNAQEAIQEYRRQQEAQSSEFHSGSPNRKLMRSSKSLG